MSSTAQASLPQTIGTYQIESMLASGGMSAVFKGRDPSTGALVAIKLGSMALANNEVLLKRFEQEHRTTSTLQHPNIVRGLDFGWDGSRPYLVMEFVDGEDLWTRIERRGRLPEAEAVSYISQVASGLHEAHKHGIIHRDIKPDNILLTKTGQAKLADLGLSKDLESDVELTQPARGIGTPNFISPEQFGDAKHAGVRCDIYSLGATLFMALTGQLPFAGRTLSAIMKLKMANDCLSPRQLVPELSEHIDWAVRRALMTDPERRHASCLEFLAALKGEAVGPEAGLAGKRSGPSPRSGKGATGAERRTAVRYDCSLPSSCTINQSLHDDESTDQAQWDAQICNLSVNGIGLLLSRRFEPGAVLKVVLTSSNGQVQRTRELCVVRVARTEGRSWFLAGKLTENFSKEELRYFL